MDQTEAPLFPAPPPVGCYARSPAPRGRLFLDRDGRINIDTGYRREPEKMLLPLCIATQIGAAQRAVIVINQSGSGRGFGWDAAAPHAPA